MALWLPLGSHASTPVAGDVLTACPAVEHPQWSDVGLCDILAVTGGSTLAPPTPVRVLQDTPSGTAAGIDRIIDMGRTVMSVNGDASCAVVMQKRVGEKV